MSTYATRTRTGQRLTEVFGSPDGWCAHIEGANTEEGRTLAAQAITVRSGRHTTGDQLELIDAGRFPRSTLYLCRNAGNSNKTDDDPGRELAASLGVETPEQTIARHLAEIHRLRAKALHWKRRALKAERDD